MQPTRPVGKQSKKIHEEKIVSSNLRILSQQCLLLSLLLLQLLFAVVVAVVAVDYSCSQLQLNARYVDFCPLCHDASYAALHPNPCQLDN